LLLRRYDDWHMACFHGHRCTLIRNMDAASPHDEVSNA